MLLAEDLLLLLLDDTEGTVHGSSQLQPALGGAVLAELALDERVEVVDPPSRWRTAKVRAVGEPPADEVLARAWRSVGEKERTAQALVDRLGKGLRGELVDRLARRGLVERRADTVLGLFPRTRWPAVDTAHEDDVRRAVAASIVRGQPTDPRTGSLVALLSALGQTAVVPVEGLSRREVRRQAKAVAEGDWAAKGVRDAVAAANAAMIAAVSASTAAAASS